MGKIIVPEGEHSSCPVNRGSTGEIHPYPILVLVFRQDFLYRNRYKFSGFVTKPEPHWRNFTIRIRAGNHLHRNVNAQYAFQNRNTPFLIGWPTEGISTLPYRTYVCKQEISGRGRIISFLTIAFMVFLKKNHASSA